MNNFLLTGDKFKPELYLKERGIFIVLVENLLNILKELKNLEKQVI